VTALADRYTSGETQLLGDRAIRLWSATPKVIVEKDEPTGGFDYPWSTLQGPSRLRLPWRWSLEPAKVIFLTSGREAELIEIGAEDNRDFVTISFSTPTYRTALGTGCVFHQTDTSLYEKFYKRLAIAPAASAAPLEETPLVVDVPGALQEARTKAGLPVQDLAAMFGIKRRQFYNLASGDDRPEHAREMRIARVTAVIKQLSERLGGNSRSVRGALLARLDGDSVHEAAIANDESRLKAALERALAAADAGTPLPRRSAPSTRATPEEAAAVRDFLRATRDENSAVRDA
jgi:transcriptional regulator with XRE-family HTH domain